MRKVLIIDDEDDIREVAALSLETVAGWQVVTANCGPEGIRMAAAEKPDAILLDVMMPEMDGPTTFKNLQADPQTSHIPVLLLTAKVQGVDQRPVLHSLGVKRRVLFKPFDLRLNSLEEMAAVLGWTD